MSFGARALIRLGALKHNLSVIRAAVPDARVMAVIKANAYGHGMVAVARTLSDVDSFAVARLPEAVELRESGVSKPIVLLSGVLTQDELTAATEQGFEIVVHCREQLALLDSHSGDTTIAWLKIDTGMNRLGFRPHEANELIELLRSSAAVRELRLMTHLSNADDRTSPATEEQLAIFKTVVADFEGAISVANTPAALDWQQIADNSGPLSCSGEHWIRPGIALFGISPYDGVCGGDLGLDPVMRFEARLISIKTLAKGERVGYKGRYTSESDSTLGIIAAGYGDGYSRHFRDGTPILLNGRRVPLIGNVSMDMLAVDLGPDASDSVGDIATLWGDNLPIEEIAPFANAIAYELVCGVMNREPSEIVT